MNAFSAFRDFLYGAVPAAFESSYELEESIERLRSGTTRSHFGALTKQAAVGVVFELEVSLQRTIPFVGNSYKPHFIGKFEKSSSGVRLVGHYTMHWGTKVFNTIWFGFCAVWTVLASFMVARTWPNGWYFPLFGLGMIFAGAALVHLGKWFARNDAVWLSGVIKSALQHNNGASRTSWQRTE